MLKKTITLMLSALCCTALLTACGGSSSKSNTENSAEEAADDGALIVYPESTNIGGKFGKAFSFEDKGYKVKIEKGWGNEEEVSMKITVTRNDVQPSVNFEDIAGSHDAGKKYVGDIDAEFLDDNDDVLFTARVGLGNYTDIDKLLALEEGDKTTITVSDYVDESIARKAVRFRLTSTLENNSHAGRPGSVLGDLDDQLESLGKAAEAVGAMAGAAAKAADAANEISKNR